MPPPRVPLAQGIGSLEATVGVAAGMLLLLIGVAGVVFTSSPEEARALGASPLFWALLVAPLLGAGIGTWAALRRLDVERRYRAHRNRLRDEADLWQARERVGRAILDGGLAAMLAFDDDGRVLEANRAAEHIFGQDAHTLRRCSIDALLPDLGQLREEDAMVRRTAAGDALGREWRTRGRHADGTIFPVQLERAELGDVPLHMVTVREATSVVKEEQRRVRDAVRAEQDRAVDLSRQRGELLSLLGRELRTHVGLVLTAGEQLARQLEHERQPDPERHHGGAPSSTLRESSHAMLVIVDKLLNIGMADESVQELSLESVAVAGLVEELAHSVQPLVDRNGNTLEVRVSEQVPILTTDRQKLAHAVRNLLSNAVQYTRGGHIQLEVVLEPGRGTDWVAFFVSDTGAGLTPEEMDQLFEAFSIPDGATTQEYLAIGTGLALSQHCARLLGGHIAVRSAAGAGSTFTLRVPLDLEHAGVSGRVEREERLHTG